MPTPYLRARARLFGSAAVEQGELLQKQLCDEWERRQKAIRQESARRDRFFDPLRGKPSRERSKAKSRAKAKKRSECPEIIRRAHRCLNPHLQPEVVGYTDGSRLESGAGGWAFHAVQLKRGFYLAAHLGKQEREPWSVHCERGFFNDTTSLHMEAEAAVRLMRRMPDQIKLEIRSDCQALIGLAQHESPTIPLMVPVFEELRRLQVVWVWVPGHQGEPGNEFVDRWARRGAGGSAGEQLYGPHESPVNGGFVLQWWRRRTKTAVARWEAEQSWATADSSPIPLAR